MITRVALPVLLLVMSASAGWLPEERLTSRTDQPDRTSLNNARAAAFDPDGNLHVVWYGRSGSQTQVWYSRCDAASGVWSPNQIISDDAAGAQLPCVTVDGSGRVHVAWTTADSSLLRYRKRTTSGLWGEIETVRNGDRITNPSIAAGRADSVFVAWSEGTLYDASDVFIMARDAVGWGNADQLSGRIQNRRVERPSVAASASGSLAVAWLDYGDVPYIICRSRAGSVWMPGDTLASGYHCDAPSLSISDEGILHGVWRQELPGGHNLVGLVYRQRCNEAWKDTVRLPRTYLALSSASIIADGLGNSHVVFMADTARSDTQLYYVKADSLGRNWTWPERLTDASQPRRNPSLSLSPEDELAVVWTDHRHSQNNPDVYVRRTGIPRDLAVVSLAVPDTVDSAQVVMPSAVVANQGAVDESFTVWLTLPNGYAESVRVDELGPGSRDTLQFSSWTASARDYVSAVCSIPPVRNDTCPTNNVLRRQFFVRVVDAAVESLEAIPVFVPVRDTVLLRAVLRNPGNVPAQGWCRFEVLDSLAGVVHRDSLEFELAAGASVEKRRAFRMSSPGSFGARVVVDVGGDMRPGNDSAVTGFDVFEPEAVIEEFVVPGPVVDSGIVVQPVVRVVNRSPGAFGLLARLRIADGYSADRHIPSLTSGEHLVDFADWLPAGRDSIMLACSLFALPDSMLIDAVSVRSFIRVLDVAADSIVSPRGMFSARDTIRPTALVRNPGNDTARFSSRFAITDSSGTVIYQDSVFLSLAPDSAALVRFADWNGLPGDYRAYCRVSLAGDMRPENDTASAEFSLVTGDVLITGIIAPAERVDSVEAVIPAVGVRNVSGLPVRFTAFFGIGDGYADSCLVEVLAPRQDTILQFREWLPKTRGELSLSCSLLLLSDSTVVGPVTGRTFVRVIDAAARSVVEPQGRIIPGPVVPVVRFGNPGNEPGVAVCRLEFAGYRDSVEVMFPAGADTLIEFAEWEAVPGTYQLVATVRMPGDMRPDNDSCRLTVVVDSSVSGNWQRLADMPTGASRRPVRRGARLLSSGRGLFGLRASGSPDWLLYLPESDNWQAVAPVPGEKLVAEGAAVCISPGDSVFLFRGRGQRDLLGYCPVSDRWRGLDSLPDGLRPVRYGTGMAYVAGDTSQVFFATGSGRFGFLVYLVEPGRWHARRPVPPGPYGRRCRHGTDLVRAGSRLFLSKGGSSEFYEYFPARDSWSARADLPPGVSGRVRRFRQGGSLAADGDSGVYALGGRGNEFWRYDIATDDWFRLADVPLGDDRRKVGRGAALAEYEGLVYLLKGGGGNEFWRYEPGPSVDSYLATGSTAAGQRSREVAVGFPFVLTAERGVLYLPETVTSAYRFPMMMLDAGGRRVMALQPGENDLRQLAAGVYFVAVPTETGGVGRVSKVVVWR